MFPLVLGLGILAGNELMRQRKVKAKEEEIAGQYRGLLGQAPELDMGPPTEFGQMGVSNPGRGLLADPADPRKQLDFAAGLMGTPGQQQAGMLLLNAAAQRAQNADQFNRGEQRAGQQWGQDFGLRQRGADRQVEQWGQEFGLRKSEAERGAEQFRQTFGLQQSEAERRAQQFGITSGMDQQRLNLAIGADKRDAAKDSAAAGLSGLGGKLPSGYEPMMTATGIVAAPMRGTPDYAAGVSKLDSLTGAQKTINDMVDMAEGKERTVNGRKVRVGGVGAELAGENAAKYSQMRAATIANVAKLRDMGVLQAGELENLEDQLPQMSGAGTLFRWNSSTMKAYKELNDQFAAKRKSHLAANPWLVPPLPPGFVGGRP